LKDNFRLVLPAESSGRAESFIENINRLPSQFPEQLDSGSFDDSIFAKSDGGHGLSPFPLMSSATTSR